MKDFSQVLQDKNKAQPFTTLPLKSQKSTHHNFHGKLPLNQQLTPIQKSNIQIIKQKVIKAVAPIILTIFTGPLNTASVLLQISDKNINQSYLYKIQISTPQNSKLVKAGIMGDNKIYKPFQFKGYHDCLSQLGKQGIKGFYKGNLTGIVLGLANTKLRTQLYDGLNKIANFSQQWKSNLLTILTCTIADFITLPIMFCQSRLIFQNSVSNFRTYPTFIDVFTKTAPKKLFSGASVLLFKNIVFSYTWYNFIKQNPIQAFILSTILSHTLTYPFMTVIRQLQTNQIGAAMMNQREQRVRDCVKRIWSNQGIRGFYRGFIGYAMVHTFLNLIMIDMNVRSGYFSQLA